MKREVIPGTGLTMEDIERLHAQSAREIAEHEAAKAKAAKAKAAQEEKAREARAAARKAMKKADVTPKRTPRELMEQAERAHESATRAVVKAEPAPRKRITKSAVAPTGSDDRTVKLQDEGITRVPSGPKRVLLEHLKAMGGKATVQALSEKLGLPLAPFSKSIKPMLSSLSKAKWISVQ